MPKIYSLLLAAFLLFAPRVSAQEPDRPNNAERARPRLEEKERRPVFRPYLLSIPDGTPAGLFVNRNMVVEPTGEQPQNESSIAINPFATNYLMSSAVDYRAGAQVYLSSNRGESWTNVNLGDVRPGWQSGNDPSVAYDYLGNGYVMYGAFPQSGYTGESGVYLSKTADNGATWLKHIKVIEHVGTMTPDSAFEDKYYIEIDNTAGSPFRGYMYTPWKRVTDRDSATQIVFTRSSDGGLTWSVPIGVSPRKPGTSTDTTFGQSFPISTTGPNGEIYLAWNDGPIRSIGFARSTDGGLTFTAPAYPVQGYPTLGTARESGGSVYHVLKGVFRAETYPSLMADNSGSPRRGWVYLVWAAGTTPDIYFIRSTDNGATWSAPKVIQSETRGDQWWPWLSVDETNGDIAVMYADSRRDPANILIDQYVSYSSDGGDTWIDRPVTDAQSDYRKNPFVNQIFAGDYSGNSFHAGRIYPSYLDTRQTGGENDVYTSLITLTRPFPVAQLRARVDPVNLTEADLTWVLPPIDRSIFDKPITGVSLLLASDAGGTLTLPPTDVSRHLTNLVIGTTYTYTLRIATAGDTSMPVSVTFRAGGGVPQKPRIVGFTEAPTVTLDVAMPTVRVDSSTRLSNLSRARLYRDSVLIREVPLSASDTGRTVSITDTPPERGYYRYHVTVVDSTLPVTESQASDAVVVYAGDLSAYRLDFDAGDPHLLVTGTWGPTTALSLSDPGSFTDSPVGNYSSTRNTTMQIYPVEAAVPIDLRFAHIAIVDPGDTAIVEVRYSGDTAWHRLASYNQNTDPKWADTSADPGDWRGERIVIAHPVGGEGASAVVRFRLRSGVTRNTDGWYIDDIDFGGISSVSERPRPLSTLASTAYPNPFSDALIISYTLPYAGAVSVTIYDALGRRVETLVRGAVETGIRSVTFDASGEPDGTYFYEVRHPAGVARGSVVLERGR
jgi:hypothetical protein